MTHTASADILNAKGIRPTATRLLVYDTLAARRHPTTLRQLADELDDVDRSTVFRTLTLLLDAGLIHAIEDGEGVTMYEVCQGHGHCTPDEHHVHFFCTECHRTYCLRSTHIPSIELPEGFVLQGINYLVKGVCPSCHK